MTDSHEKTPTVAFRMPAAMARQLAALAKKKRVTRSWLIREFVRRGIEAAR